MATKKKKPAARKRNAPKKTGKSGIGPVETEETTDSQVADQQELAMDGNKDTPETQEADPAKKGKRGRKPAQKRLPEMDDPEIEELEGLAEQYAEYRDKRMHAG